MGEVKVVEYLVRELRRRQRDVALHVTVMTRTGFQDAGTRLGRDITISYFPLDTTPLIRRTLDAIQPKAIVITETEIWPNLALEAASRGIPIVLVNGRMSEKSFGRYRFIRKVLGRVLAAYDRFFFKTEDDRQRYGYFGVDPQVSRVVGDMKFDAPLADRSTGRVAELRGRLGIADDGFLLIAGSTRPGEEEVLLRAIVALRHEHPRLRLLLAPRHLERLTEVLALVNAAGMKPREYSKIGADAALDVDTVIVMDRMGVLAELYQAADLAFVGGTLVPLGGHNILEPVWAQAPVLYGPFLDNVLEAAEYIEKHSYGARVGSAEEFQRTLAGVLEGRIAFRTKTEQDHNASPTAEAAEYILNRIRHA
jgi:3-deoxy-D-manno-octulosonic-acid transferase